MEFGLQGAELRTRRSQYGLAWSRAGRWAGGAKWRGGGSDHRGLPPHPDAVPCAMQAWAHGNPRLRPWA